MDHECWRSWAEPQDKVREDLTVYAFLMFMCPLEVLLLLSLSGQQQLAVTVCVPSSRGSSDRVSTAQVHTVLDGDSAQSRRPWRRPSKRTLASDGKTETQKDPGAGTRMNQLEGLFPTHGSPEFPQDRGRVARAQKIKECAFPLRSPSTHTGCVCGPVT